MALRRGVQGCRWWVKCLVGLLAVLVLAVVALLWVLPKRPVTYRDAVVIALLRQDIAFRDVSVGELRLPREGQCYLHDCRAGTAYVTVIQEQPVSGRIVCLQGDAECALALAALGIYGAPLPDLRDVRRFPRTIEELWLVVRATVRRALDLS